MVTLERLRHSRDALFWTMHTAGWATYAITQYFGALLYEKPLGYLAFITVAALAGFLYSMPLRYVYRRLAKRRPRTIILGVLLACYLTALPLRATINYAHFLLVDPEMQFDSWLELYVGSLSSTYVLLCYSGLFFAVRYYESLQQQREAALQASALAQEAQLKMLRYQLNPHFLFNTLNAISTLILDQQNRSANQAVARLAAFLRYTLDQDPMKKVTLRQEIAALNLYLDTERLRFGERMNLEFVIAEQVQEALIPSLLLQPIIENAVKYAISPRIGGGSIRIEARSREAMLELLVIDDGPGLPASGGTRERRSGIGLRNTRERMQVLYGERQRFVLANASPGLRVELTLPLEYRAEENALPTAQIASESA